MRHVLREIFPSNTLYLFEPLTAWDSLSDRAPCRHAKVFAAKHHLGRTPTPQGRRDWVAWLACASPACHLVCASSHSWPHPRAAAIVLALVVGPATSLTRVHNFLFGWGERKEIRIMGNFIFFPCFSVCFAFKKLFIPFLTFFERSVRKFSIYLQYVQVQGSQSQLFHF